MCIIQKKKNHLKNKCFKLKHFNFYLFPLHFIFFSKQFFFLHLLILKKKIYCRLFIFIWSESLHGVAVNVLD